MQNFFTISIVTILYYSIVDIVDTKIATRGQSNLAKAASNDPAHTARAAAELSRVTY